MVNKNLISAHELAKLLNLSHVAVWKKIKAGKIKAVKVGRNFVIDKSDLDGILNDNLTLKNKQSVESAVKKTVRDYGETLKLLGNA